MSARVASTSIRSNYPAGLARQRRGALAAPELHQGPWPLATPATTRASTCSRRAGTPIYAAAAGVVKVSQESFGGYGVAVTIDHVIGGQRVSTLYGHMTYGSRQVGAGQTVAGGSAHRPRRQHRQLDRVPPALRGAHQRLGRRPVGLAAGQRRLTVPSDTPPRVHRRLRPSRPRACVSLKPDAERSGGEPMGDTPRIRTMDALGRLVLRHHTSGCRGIAVAPRRCL